MDYEQYFDNAIISVDVLDKMIDNYCGRCVVETSRYQVYAFDFSEGIITLAIFAIKRQSHKRYGIYYIDILLSMFEETGGSKEDGKPFLSDTIGRSLIPVFEAKSDLFFMTSH